MKPMEGTEAVLARAGQRMERRFENDNDESVAWVEAYRTRTYDLKTTRTHLISLRDQWKHASDLIEITRTVRMNLEFDFKRKLVSPTDFDGMLTANTRPWRSLAEFEAYRDAFELWRTTYRRCCVTKSDFLEFERWKAQRPIMREAGLTSKAARPPLVQMFFRAWGKRLSGMVGGHVKELAEITSRWWPTSEDAIKKAKRYGSIAPVKTADTPSLSGPMPSRLAGQASTGGS